MKIIIVGCGRMGSELAGRVSADGYQVTVVDKNPRSFYRLDKNLRESTVVGWGFDRDVLVRAGIEACDALAAVTSGDNANIVIARVARNVFRVPKVVARLYDPRRAEIYHRLGLRSISSTSWGVSRVMQLLSHRDLDVTCTLGDGEVELVELEIPPQWVSRAVNQVNVPGEVLVTGLTRLGKTIIPTGGTLFQEGDRVAVSVATTARGRLEQLLSLS